MGTLSYVHGASAQPLLGDTIGDQLKQTAARLGDREALVSRAQNYRATWSQLWHETGRVARGLLALGVQKGDRVGIWSPNRYEWTLLQLGSARIGAILVTINPAYRASELEYALTQSGTSVLITATGFKGADYLGMLSEVRPKLPSLREVIVLDRDWQRMLDSGADDAALAAREATLGCDDPINIQYTSGTTGRPKGATLSHHNILNNGYFVGAGLHYSERDRVCIPVPFYHCFGMVIGNLACISHGATMVIPSEAFDPLAVLETVSAERCTSLYGVPTMFIGVLDHPRFGEFDLSSLRTGIMAGSPCPVELMKRVLDKLHMPEVCIAYGMTETSPCSTQTSVDDPIAQRVGSVGRVHPHVEVKVVDPATGTTVARGERGELCTRGYCVMLGYWSDEAATRRAIDEARWMHTGDLATIDERGYVNIVGRIKDMIIRGGENVYPREIEEILHGHPDVADVQVIGVPSEKYGEEVMAWVKPRPGAHLSIESLATFCKAQMAHFKVPRWFKLTDDFPMTVTGKVQKFRMRELAIIELGLQAAAEIKTA
jgi:fatty-acyl-CoA synthase